MSDFTFNEFLTGILKFNDENVMHIGFNSDTEDIIITNWNAAANTHKTLQTNLNGGGGSNRETEILDGSLSGVYENLDVTVLKEYALQNCSQLTGVNMPALINPKASAFRNCTALSTVNIPEVTNIGQYCFTNCSSLTTVDMPKLTSVYNNGFENCTSLASVNLPSATTVGNSALKNCAIPILVLPAVSTTDANAFSSNSVLTTVDFGALTRLGASNGFLNDSALTTMIIRTASVAALSNTNTFNGTPFAVDGAGGDVYVKAALISDYEIATNWSALNVTFKAIEGSYYETHYADGTVI